MIINVIAVISLILSVWSAVGVWQLSKAVKVMLMKMQLDSLFGGFR